MLKQQQHQYYWLVYKRDDLTLDFNIFIINVIKAFFMCVNAFNRVNIQGEREREKQSVIKIKGQ